MSETRVMWVHVLRNASIPIITNVMISSRAARGRVSDRALLLDSRRRPRSDPRGGAKRFSRDQAVTIYVAIATMIINLIADLLYRRSIRGCSSSDAGRAFAIALQRAESPGLWTLAGALSPRPRGARLVPDSGVFSSVS